MSGPKGYGYSVISEAEHRRREDVARSGRCEQHVITLAGLFGQLRYFGAPVSDAVREPLAKTHEALLAWEDALQKAIDDAEARIREESANAIRLRLNSSKDAVDVAGVSLGARRSRDRPTSPALPSPASSRLPEEIAKVVELIAGLRDASMREDFTQLAERVAQTTSPAQAKGDLLTLKTKVSNALQVQDYRGLAARAALEIAHIATQKADAVRARAAAVTSAHDLSEVRQSVAELATAEARARDAEFVEAALEEVLGELGFAIGEGFELVGLGRSVAVANHAEHPGYGVRVQLNPGNGMIYTRVVAERATSAEQDARAEDETCGKVHAMAKRLPQHGVATELKLERQPGETQVERVEAKPASTRRRRPRSHTTRQARTAG